MISNPGCGVLFQGAEGQAGKSTASGCGLNELAVGAADLWVLDQAADHLMLSSMPRIGGIGAILRRGMISCLPVTGASNQAKVR
jgi:hypothetical protein